MAEITQEQRKAVKAQGFLSNKDKTHFSARVITENGVLNTEQLQTISHAATAYGNGHVGLTSRLTVEIQGVTFDHIEPLKKFLADNGLAIGGTGNKVRPVVACKGSVCQFGLIDTYDIATKIHKCFFEGYAHITLPNKFKICVGGCQNNCAKPSLNDFGIVGKGKACVVYLGGRWGKVMRHGTPMSRTLQVDEMLDLLERTIMYYKDNALPGERFGTTLDRIGVETVEQALFLAYDVEGF